MRWFVSFRSILVAVALFAPPPILAQLAVPGSVGLYERTYFGRFTAPVGSISNPFTQVKITAVFSHMMGSFSVPVVCTATQPELQFPIWFAPPYTGAWSLSFTIEVESTPPGVINLGAEDPVHDFTCLPSTAKGPWRPATPEGRPFAVVEPQGDGTVVYRRPMSTTLLHLADPRWLSFPGYYAYPSWPSSPNPSYLKGDSSFVISILDDAVARGFNRVRIALNYTSQRSTPPAEIPAAPPYYPAVDPTVPGQFPLIQYSAFAFQNPASTTTNTKYFNGTGSAQTCNLDFERFDLGYWSHLEWIIGLCKDRGIQVCITLTLNSGGGADFEDQYLASALPPLPSNVETAAVPLLSPQLFFQHRYDVYYWYVIGRLGAFPNVQYTLMHEYQLPEPNGCSIPLGASWGCPYTAEWVRWFGQRFSEREPYLSHNPSSKIVTLCPRRGSLYASFWSATPNKIGFSTSPAVNTGVSRLSENVSTFLEATDRSWLSCIGLQRGGEIGLSSITGSTDELYAFSGYWGTASNPVTGHRPRLSLGGLYTPCPIFIEEDWVVGNTAFDSRLPAAVFNSLDNPYCVRPQSFLHVGEFAPLLSANPELVDNPYALPGLASNQEGIEKWSRDYVWGAGIIAGAHVAFWGHRYATLAQPFGLFEPEVAMQPYRAAALFCEQVDWWDFAPDLTVVVGQIPAAGDRPFQGTVNPGNLVGSAIPSASGWRVNNPPPPTGPNLPAGTTPRPAIERQVVAARSIDGGPPRLIVYSPVTGERGVGGAPPVYGPASFSLDLTGFPDPTTVQYVNPCTLEASPAQTLSLGTNPASVSIQPPPANSGWLAPLYEYVVLMNFTIAGA